MAINNESLIIDKMIAFMLFHSIHLSRSLFLYVRHVNAFMRQQNRCSLLDLLKIDIILFCNFITFQVIVTIIIVLKSYSNTS